MFPFLCRRPCLSDDDDEEVAAALGDPFELPVSDSPGGYKTLPRFSPYSLGQHVS